MRGLILEGLRHEYSVGIPDPPLIKPEGYTDAALLARPGDVDIQLDLFLDYASNAKLYRKFQEYFRTAQPPFLAVWGQFDPYFIPAGAKAFQKDIPNATIEFLLTGHFALETHFLARLRRCCSRHEHSRVPIPPRFRGVARAAKAHQGSNMVYQPHFVLAGTWSRGHQADWDMYAAEAGDRRWGYEATLELYRSRVEDWAGVPDPSFYGRGGASRRTAN